MIHFVCAIYKSRTTVSGSICVVAGLADWLTSSPPATVIK